MKESNTGHICITLSMILSYRLIFI